jgi:hypothetical protein
MISTKLFPVPGKASNLQVLEKTTELVDDKQRIVESIPFIVRETQTENGMSIRKAMGIFLHQYLASLASDRRELISRYHVLDAARKAVGVGSVGTRCWIIFMRGSDDGDPLFLQLKEAQRSVLADYLDSHLSRMRATAWSVGKDWPAGPLFGFDRFYGFIAGDTNQWYPALYRDNSPIDPPATPEEEYHLSEDLVDKSIEFIANHEFVDRVWRLSCSPPRTQKLGGQIQGKVRHGLGQVIREAVLDRQKKMGVVPRSAAFSPMLGGHTEMG